MYPVLDGTNPETYYLQKLQTDIKKILAPVKLENLTSEKEKKNAVVACLQTLSLPKD